MAVEADRRPKRPVSIGRLVTRPRPGHADLAGVVKYGHDDIRNVLERASARETAARVAVGAIARQLLAAGRHGDRQPRRVRSDPASLADPLAVTFEDVQAIGADSPLHCVDAEVERRMIAEIDRAREAGDTMGGSFEVIAHGVPPGLGSHVQWDRKLDGRLAQALMSIPAIKARRHRPRARSSASLPGSRIHDEILPPQRPAAHRRSASPAHQQRRRARGRHHQRRGPPRHRGYMKPIATLMKPLRSVDLDDDGRRARRPSSGATSAPCPPPRSSAKRWSRIVLADALTEKFGGDSVDELVENWRAFRARTTARFSASQAR